MFAILALAYVVTSGPAPGLTERFGRRVIATGGAALTAGLALLAAVVAEIGTGGTLLALVPGLVLVEAGIGLCFTPLTSVVLATVEPARAGSASGAMSTIQQVGYALGVAVTGVIFFGAADEGVARAFELSLVQMAAVSAGIVAMTRLLPQPDRPERTSRMLATPALPGSESGMRRLSRKLNKWPIRWTQAMEHARIDISEDLDGQAVVHAVFDLSSDEIAGAAHAVRSTAAARYRIASISADDVLALRELTALGDELGELTSGASTVVLRPARLSAFREAVSQYVETREEAEWIRGEDRQPLAILRELLWPLEQLDAEATRAALAPGSRSSAHRDS